MNDITENLQAAHERALHQIEDLKIDLAAARSALESERLVRRHFAKRLSQEFRIPLNAMLGFSQILKTSMREDLDSIEKVVHSGQQMLRMIEEMSTEDAVPESADAPRSTPPPLPPQQVKTPVEASTGAPAPGRLLYIEDQITNVQMVELMLHRLLGISLSSAETGRKGLARAVEERPDLILLDLNLPDMHGSEVIRALQENPATAPIPVIVISGDAAPSQIDRLLAAGARDYLVKPFKLDRLKGAVEDLLHEIRQAA